MTVHKCPRCGRQVAREYSRKGLVAVPPATLTLKPGVAPAVVCGRCQARSVLWKGSVG